MITHMRTYLRTGALELLHMSTHTQTRRCTHKQTHAHAQVLQQPKPCLAPQSCCTHKHTRAQHAPAHMPKSWCLRAAAHAHSQMHAPHTRPQALQQMKLMPGALELLHFTQGVPRGLITRNVMSSVHHFHNHHLVPAGVSPFLPGVPVCAKMPQDAGDRAAL